MAELGDKSQLMALTFATRFKPVPVLIGITVATALVHLVSVGIGYGLGATLPTGWISLIAGIAFLVFGAWTLRGDKLTDDEKSKAERTTGSAIVAVGGAFFLAELGDKTMLATITLATQHGWFGTWVGLDGRHGRRRRARHPGRPAARPAPAREGHQVRRGRALRYLRHLADRGCLRATPTPRRS